MQCCQLVIICLLGNAGHVSASVVEVENPDTFEVTDVNNGDDTEARDMAVIRVLATCGACLYGWSEADVQLTRAVAMKEWARICCKRAGLAALSAADIAGMEWLRDIDEAFVLVEKVRAEQRRLAAGSEGRRGKHKRIFVSSRAFVNDKGGEIWKELITITVSTLATALRSEPETVEAAMEMAHCLQTIRRMLRVKLVEVYHQLLVETLLAQQVPSQERRSDSKDFVIVSNESQGLESESKGGEGIATGNSRRRSASGASLVEAYAKASPSVPAAAKVPLPPSGRSKKSVGASPSKRRSSWSSGVKGAAEAVSGGAGVDARHSESAAVEVEAEFGAFMDAAAVLELCSIDGDSDDDEDFVVRLDQLYVGVEVAERKKTGCGQKTRPMGMQDMLNKCVKVGLLHQILRSMSRLTLIGFTGRCNKSSSVFHRHIV
jgi:hypothetical protein